MNAIAPIQMPFGEIERLAHYIAKSSLFGIKTPEQAIALMMIAQAEGRHPALAARDYDVIQGRPSKKAEAMLRDFLEAGGKVEWHALTDALADATFSHPQGGTVRVTWDMARGAAAGLAGKDNWKKFPRQMLRSRTVSEGVRTVWPLATSGLYVSEETADMPAREPQRNGPTLEHEAEPTPPEPEPETRREAINRETPLHPTPPKPKAAAGVEDALRGWTEDELLKTLEISIKDCGTLGAVNKVIAHPQVQTMLRDFKGDHKAKLEGIIAGGIAAHAAVVHPDAEADIWGDAPVTEPAGAG
jgi:hypothetical protein